MKRQIRKWQMGRAVLAAGLLALALAACADGNALGGNIPAPLPDDDDIVFRPKPPVDPKPDDPVEDSKWSIKEEFAIQLDPASSYFFRDADVTVSTADFEGVPAEDTAVTVTFDGDAVSSTVEITSSEIKATFQVSKGAEIGKHRVVMSVGGVASEEAEFEVKDLIAIRTLLMNRDFSFLPMILPNLIIPNQDNDPQGSAGENGPGSGRSGGDNGSGPGGSGGNNGSGSDGSGGGGGDDTPPTEPKHIAAGEKHTCVAKGNRVYCWGSSEHFQLGDGMIFHHCAARDAGASNSNDGGCLEYSYEPVVVLEENISDKKSFDASGVTKLAAGRNHTCALKDDGTVWCWGSNQHGQLGGGIVNRNGNNECFPNQYSSTVYDKYYGAVQVFMNDRTTLGNVVDIDASGDRTCALTSRKTLSCWGKLADRNSTCAAIPVKKAVNGEYNPPLTPIGGIEDFAVGDEIFVKQRDISTIASIRPAERSNPLRFSLTNIAGTEGLSELSSSGDTLCAITNDATAFCAVGDHNTMLPIGSVSSVVVGEEGNYNGSRRRVVCAFGGNSLTCRELEIAWRDRQSFLNWDVAVIEPPSRGQPLPGDGVESVAVGDRYVCYIGADKKVYCGGNSCTRGQCGADERQWDKAPHEVPIP